MAKSFTIKLGADTTDFINEMKKADKQISSTQRTAQELEKSLDLKFDSSRAVEAQKLYQKALTETEQKAEAIRNQLKILESSGRMETTDYQKLQTELAKSEAQALKLKNQLDNVKNIEIEKISKKFTDVGNDITKAGQKLSVFSAAAAGAIAGIVKLTKDAVEQGDEISKLATQYDMSTKAIQQWEYVALQSDVSTDSILKGAQKVQAAFGDQMTGATSTATKALEALGLNYKNFDSNEQAFEATITELSKIKNATEQAAYANDIFGERFASSLIPLLQSGDAVADYLAEFEQVGYLSDETVSKLSDLDNEVNKVTAAFEQSKTELGVAMIPIYEILIDILENKVIPAIEKLTEWFDNLSPSGQETVLTLLAIIAAAAPLMILIGKMSTGVGTLISWLKTLKSQSIITMGGIAALTGALALGINLIADWKNMSTIEKILKSLAFAALIAAGAVAVFHAAWSLGIAVGAIAAGIVAAIASVKAAEEELTGDTKASDEVAEKSSGTTSGNGLTEQDMADIDSWTNAGKSGYTGGNTYQSEEDNSTNNYYITVEANEYTNADEIIDVISKKIATIAQSRG